jgi:hypothetical protein
MIACWTDLVSVGCGLCLVLVSSNEAARKSAANSVVRPPSNVSTVVSVVTDVNVDVVTTGLGTEVIVQVVKSVSVQTE